MIHLFLHPTMDLGFLPYLLLKSMAIDDKKGIGLNNMIWFLSDSIQGFQK